MPERNSPACPLHGDLPRARAPHNFFGIVTVIDNLIETISGVGTTSYTRCPYGYPPNFEGVVRALEDLNSTASGIEATGGLLVPGSGISITTSGLYSIIASLITQSLPGSGVLGVASGANTIFDVNIQGEGNNDVEYDGKLIQISGTNEGAVAVVSGLVGGDGITITASGDTAVVSTDLIGQGSVDFSYNASRVGVISGTSQQLLVAGSGTSVTQSGDFQIVDIGVIGEPGIGVTYSGSFVTLENLISTGSGTSVAVSGDFKKVDVGALPGTNVTIGYSGAFFTTNSTAEAGASVVTVSGEPGDNFLGGSLWFDTNEGRLFVYASGNDVTKPDWYIANAEALAIKSEVPPSGTGGLNAPPRDGTIWFNNLMGSLFVYDAPTSGWYESAPSRTPSYGDTPPVYAVDGAQWTDSRSNVIHVWDGTQWADVIASGNDPGLSQGDVIGLIMGLS